MKISMAPRRMTTEGRVRRRIAGEPPLPVLRNKADVEGRTTYRRSSARPRRRDRSRARAPRLPGAGRRSATGLPIVRRARPQGGHRRRNARIHRHVSGHGEDGAHGGLRGIADWFETLAKAERSHANRFQKALDALAD